jgi:hypothetical protein
MASTEARLPKKRSDLVEVDLTDEIVVYDQKTGDAHALNGAAAKVWRLLSSASTVDALAKRVAAKSEMDGRAAVHLALKQFSSQGLLDGPVPSFSQAGVSRRKMLQQLAFAGAAIPAIQSVKRPQGTTVLTSAMPCTDTATQCFGVCPGNQCCVCSLTTEATSVCIVPTCTPEIPIPCTSSAGCPSGFVCVGGNNVTCCPTTPGFSFCVPLCTPGQTAGVICSVSGGYKPTSKKGTRPTTWSGK